MVGARKLMKFFHLRRTHESASSSQTDRSSPQWIEAEIDEDSRLCRACLRAANIPIYGNYDYPDVSREFQDITGIKIKVFDEYPKYLCEHCHTLLQSGIQLRNVAKYSESILRPDTYPKDSDDEHDANDDYCERNDFTHVKIKQEHVKITQEHVKIKQEPNNPSNKRSYHKKSCALDSKFVCGRCKRFFDTEQEYNVHLASKEHLNCRATCPVCKKDFNVLYLKYHMNYHRTDITYVCDKCGKNFTVKARFDAHRRMHSNGLPYKCTNCPYRGRSKSSLKVHMRTHTKDKPYKCPQCPDRSFVNWSNLNTHLFTHKTEKNIKCDQCTRSFHFKPQLERHIRAVHLGIKDHVCNICGKAFGLRHQMMKHQTKVHNRKKSEIGKKPLYLMPEYQNQENSENEKEQKI